jgi:hypothetical protein
VTWLDELAQDGYTVDIRTHVEGWECIIYDPYRKWEEAVNVRAKTYGECLTQAGVAMVRYRIERAA